MKTLEELERSTDQIISIGFGVAFQTLGGCVMVRCLIGFVVFLLNDPVSSAGIVLFDFSLGTGAPVSNPVSGVVFGNMGVFNTFGGGSGVINNTSASNFSGASGSFNIGNAVNNATFSITASPYFSVTATNSTSAVLMLNDFDFGARSTPTGATSIALRSSFDSFASDLVLVSNNANSSWAFLDQTFAPIMLGSGATVDFRIYTFGGASNAVSNLINTRLDDIRFDVSTLTAVPEPSSVLLLGLASVSVGIGRRWRQKRIAV